MERLNEALEVVDSGEDKSKKTSSPERAQVQSSDDESKDTGGAGSKREDNQDAISKAMAEIEATLRRFAEAERGSFEEEIAGWKAQFKKAAMIVIKKQVEAARANWIKRPERGSPNCSNA